MPRLPELRFGQAAIQADRCRLGDRLGFEIVQGFGGARGILRRLPFAAERGVEIGRRDNPAVQVGFGGGSKAFEVFEPRWERRSWASDLDGLHQVGIARQESIRSK